MTLCFLFERHRALNECLYVSVFHMHCSHALIGSPGSVRPN